MRTASPTVTRSTCTAPTRSTRTRTTTAWTTATRSPPAPTSTASPTARRSTTPAPTRWTRTPTGGGRTDGEEVLHDETDPLDASDDVDGSDDDDGLLGGHLDVDTSTFISAWTSGSTDAHKHEYDDAYDVTSVDWFALQSNSLDEIDEAITDPSQRFKLIIANADLSPGARLSINGAYDATDPTSWTDATTYDDTALADLTVYSLGGASGSTPLTALELGFHRLAIPSGDLHPTLTGCVRDNDPGAAGEWRNGALTIQAVEVDSSGADAFTTDTSFSNGGVQGVATSGLLWEATMFWHYSGDCYGEPTWPAP